MTEEEKKIEQKILPWRFGVVLSVSAFLFVTFILYLPMRFLYTMTMHAHRGTYQEAANVHQGIAVDLGLSSSTPVAGSPVGLDLYVNDKTTGQPILFTNLETEHAKLMHVLGVRSDLQGFFHIHPYPYTIPGHFAVDATFSMPGRYKIWSQVTKGGVTYTFGHSPVEVVGSGGSEPIPPDFTRKVTMGEYTIGLNAPDKIAKNRVTLFGIDVHDRGGNEVPFEDYLGATMHLAIIKNDWTQFIHTHPADGSGHTHVLVPFKLINEAHADGVHGTTVSFSVHGVPFQVNFPEAGVYRAFAQFRPLGVKLPQDEAITAAFWIRVDQTAPSQTTVDAKTAWWWLLVVSLVSIIVLNNFVKKYLKVRT